MIIGPPTIPHETFSRATYEHAILYHTLILPRLKWYKIWIDESLDEISVKIAIEIFFKKRKDLIGSYIIFIFV